MENTTQGASGYKVYGHGLSKLRFDIVGMTDQMGDLDTEIDMNIDAASQEGRENIYVVHLNISATASIASKPIFKLSMVYQGGVWCNMVNERDRQDILLVEAPKLMFPFARQIVSDTVLAAGFGPLLIDPAAFQNLINSVIDETETDAQWLLAPSEHD